MTVFFLTWAVPSAVLPITPAAAFERSMMRPAMYGPRSFDSHIDRTTVSQVSHPNTTHIEALRGVGDGRDERAGEAGQGNATRRSKPAQKTQRDTEMGIG